MWLRAGRRVQDWACIYKMQDASEFTLTKFPAQTGEPRFGALARLAEMLGVSCDCVALSSGAGLLIPFPSLLQVLSSSTIALQRLFFQRYYLETAIIYLASGNITSRKGILVLGRLGGPEKSPSNPSGISTL